MQPLTEILREALVHAGATGFCVAFSGGRDSTVLLHALRHLELGPPLRAVHVDHGLQPAAADWRAHCESVCRSWNVPLHVARVQVSTSGRHGGLEAAAREARYGALRAALADGEFLMTAHHADDQLETVLLRLMRGGGPAGVAGIRRCAAFGPGMLVRPMLAATARQVAAYARDHALDWVEDPSNRDEGLDRNYLRHRVIPALAARWPAAAVTAARTARLADEGANLLDRLAQVDSRATVEADTVRLDALAALEPARQRNLVRWFLHERGAPPPAAAALGEGLHQLLDARGDAHPRLSWAAGELRRYRGRLYLLRCHPDDEPVPPAREWDGTVPLQMGALVGQLKLRQPAAAALCDAPLTVRFRHGGERLLRHGQHVRLKTLFQDGGIVPWMRRFVPLVFCDDELLSVGGLWYADDALGGRAGPVFEVSWTPGERLR